MAVRRTGEEGQMTVELCIVFPVVIVVAVIAVNALLFFGDCAALDRAGRNAVRVLASSPATTDDPATIAARIEAAVRAEMGTDAVQCTVQRGREGTECFALTYSFSPTLFGLGLRDQIWGVPLPRLTHTTELVVDSFSPHQEVDPHVS